MATVYILHSKKLNRFYTGYTNDLDVRMNFHSIAHSNKFTGKADDWILFLQIECKNKVQALAVERHIKRMKSKVYIENLKKYPEMLAKLKNTYSDC
ncbi:GIY-YIG nuclease family protein [Salinimicrobium sp. TH3]|uniref:GIY-YIG nuclease family protein n=1 Tax=Salinimicrobium sp. TH3 TaxID=2997342 RepID=UPI00227540CB|nr:GIY-YIG nuclease family protein [Salinimicrobium sp. TH3]MCY2686643.1 GIY-YIG nuclease family protein [Salinimicrobium sp. TH3]